LRNGTGPRFTAEYGPEGLATLDSAMAHQPLAFRSREKEVARMGRKKDKTDILDVSGPPDLVSLATIAAAMGVYPSAAKKIAENDTRFPKPYVIIPGGGPRFDANAVRAWMRSFGTEYMNPSGRRRRQKPTVVYFIRCDVFVKIGFTQNVAARVAMLQTGTPHELEVLHTTPGGVDEEGRLHALFAEERVRPGGEWFRLGPRLLEYIAAIKSQGGV